MDVPVEGVLPLREKPSNLLLTRLFESVDQIFIWIYHKITMSTNDSLAGKNRTAFFYSGEGKWNQHLTETFLFKAFGDIIARKTNDVSQNIYVK